MCDLEDFGPDSLQKRQATPSCVVYGKKSCTRAKTGISKTNKFTPFNLRERILE